MATTLTHLRARLSRDTHISRKWTIEAPIIVVDGLDVSVYDSIENVLIDLEGPDVEDGCYQVFDSRGRIITLRAERLRRTWSGVQLASQEVALADVEALPSGSEVLRGAVAEHLRAVGGLVPEGAPLAALVEQLGRRGNAVARESLFRRVIGALRRLWR